MQVDLLSPWWIRDVEIPSRLVLAPMAGVSVQAFRRQGRRFGAGLVCSEMVSCAGLQHGNERTLGYLRIASDERPLAVQMYTGEADHSLTAELVEQVDVPVIASGDVTSRARAQAILATTGAAAVMVGRAAQGNPWALREIVEGDAGPPTREEVVAELILFMRETVRELGEHRSTGFLKKFYGWYLGRGRFPRPFKQELVQLETLDEVEARLLAAAPGAGELLERLEAELPDPADEVLLDSMPISIYGG